jgi:hypothetical protein
MWERQRLLHSLRTRARNGHVCFMRLCLAYAPAWKCKLTPADHAYIRKKHAAEIEASAKPFDEAKWHAKQLAAREARRAEKKKLRQDFWTRR